MSFIDTTSIMLTATLMPETDGAQALLHQESGLVFDTTTLRDLRAAARVAGRSVITEIEERHPEQGRAVVAALAAMFSWPVIETADMDLTTPLFSLLPLADAMQRQALLLEQAGNVLAVVGDPFDADLQTWLGARCSKPLCFHLALRADIQAYLSKQEQYVRAVDNIVADGGDGDRDGRSAEVLSFASLNVASSPAVRLVNSTLYDALKAAASDIHLESTTSGLTIKYRIDGVLDHARSIAGRELAGQVISRLKVLAELDISERRTPQDGSFRVESSGRDIDLRVSIMPSIHGEDAVIRILDKRAMIESYGSLSLEALGFDEQSLRTLRRLADEPYGMLLVTGPTGSGKTTTLYGALTEVNNGRDKIITIEDPVEYQLPGILQIPVNDKKGLTFARGLRSILRHDPDKIMVGEIRDRETAEIAVQSALTGHLVLTTVHANNVFDVFGRFTHMGIDPYAFVSALNGIWAQRLVRNNCPHCAVDIAPDAAQLERLGMSAIDVTGFRLRAGTGCGDCRGTGYKGRTAIAEILSLNDEIRELIVEKAPVRQIKDAAARHGTRSLREVALDLARRGVTTLEEVKRVTLQS
ncbi:type II secretion system (T2SS), E, N-terminal domain protein [Collimonas fungivorans]|uniref:Type II secretion system (T2SS), E, N-terminal domain protein n=2 Tax=Collimonas fungivorans TaxID=158899 RepID=A0A127PC62_9BURK|nr:GspE/PulE family protein [Collimonas fungivorans]AMO95392.1 type II secretion system (T2SS), E, N-terminal domain protein [Collimonas fungivorans]